MTETITARIRLGRWLRFRLWLLAWGCGLAACFAPRREERILGWLEARTLSMVERGARVEIA